MHNTPTRNRELGSFLKELECSQAAFGNSIYFLELRRVE